MEFLLRINVEIPIPEEERNKNIGEILRIFAARMDDAPFAPKDSVVIHRKARNEDGSPGADIFIAEGMYSDAQQIPAAKIIMDLNHPSPEHFGQTRNGNGRKRGK